MPGVDRDMKITCDQTYQTPLTEFGAELARMIKDCAHAQIAARFGYAVAHDRPSADAIESDIGYCLGGERRSATIAMATEARIFVKYFKQPNGGLFGLVECFLPLDHDTGELLAELIVTTHQDEFHLSLEDISYAAKSI